MNSMTRAAIVVGIFALGIILYRQHEKTSRQDQIKAYQTVTQGQMLLYGAIRNDYEAYMDNYNWVKQGTKVTDFYQMNKKNLTTIASFGIVQSNGAIDLCYKGENGGANTCMTVTPKVTANGDDIQVTFSCDKSDVDPAVLKNLFPDCLTHHDAVTEPEWSKLVMQTNNKFWGHWPGTGPAAAE
jgi:hypothetical protein